MDDFSYISPFLRFRRGYEAVPESSAQVDVADSVSGSFRQGVWQSFSLALVAEIGDKTFFIACIMAMRYNRVYTFFGSWLALCVMTGLSCALGTAIKGWVSPMVVHYIAASLFLVFGLHMFYEAYKNRNTSATSDMEEVAAEMRNDDEELRVRFRKNSKSEDSTASPGTQDVTVEIMSSTHSFARSNKVQTDGSGESVNTTSASTGESTIRQKVEHFCLMFLNKIFYKAFLLTFVAEWGDKSQLATIELASLNPIWSVFIGSAAGYVICVGLAVGSGRFIVSKIKLTYLNILGGVIFLVFSGFTFHLAITNEND